MSNANIDTADISWNAQGLPVSSHFDDLYFSAHDGLAETRYVFLQQNDLYQRWLNHDQDFYVIAETGFGTGLNFLAVWQLFEQFRQSYPDARCRRLHMISFEKFPLTKADLIKALSSWPELSEFSQYLIDQYPIATAECHRLKFADDKIVLDLWLGDIKDTLPQIYVPENGLVDSWFLDGFAPSKNPQMWTEELFAGMYDLARANATFSTFTAAGFVRRGLIAAGWQVEKAPGFGCKREMLIGRIADKPLRTQPTPWFNRTRATGNRVAIIGGGIASAFSALSLISRGYEVDLYCKDSHAADGASGNRQGAVYPLLNGQAMAQESFFLSAFQYALQSVKNLSQHCRFGHGFSGLLQLAYDDKAHAKLTKIAAAPYPDAIVSWQDAATLSELANVAIPHPGLHYPNAFWVSPAELTQAILELAITSGRLNCHYNCQITALEQTTCKESEAETTQWQLITETGDRHNSDIVIVAAGHHATDLAQCEKLPLTPTRGQVTHIDTHESYTGLSKILCYRGYMTPVNGNRAQHCIGASTVSGNADTAFSQQEQIQNRDNLRACLAPADWPEQVKITDTGYRTRVRCNHRDHLPVLGNVGDFEQTLAIYSPQQKSDNRHPAPVYPNLYINGALGARGLCSAPLLAEILASQIAGEPMPLPTTVLNAISPNRTWVNSIFKGRPVKVKN